MLALTLAGAPLALFYPVPARHVVFPDGRRFAFSIVDDTDMATLARVEPVYEVLYRYGLRTTKTVWVYASNELTHSPNRGDSLQDPAYRKFIVDLQKKGFEIALHGVRGGSSRRGEIRSGLEEFRKELGQYPRMFVNHSVNRDNLYWGKHLYDFAPYRWAVGLATRREFSGEDRNSEYFWGDLAQQHIRYVRRFTFPQINLLDVIPALPYRLPDKPYVNYWFPTSDGDRIREFDVLLRPENLDKLEREGGVCLVYAHLGSGSFTPNGRVDARFEARIKDLASRNGWFAPASDILDYLRAQPGWTGELGVRDRLRVDTEFIFTKLMRGMF